MGPARSNDVPVCPLCGSEHSAKMGIRGTREYFGADPNCEPHLVTDVVRCQACDFIYADPMHENMGQLEKAYYSDPEKYSATAGCESSKMYQTRLEFIAKYKTRGALLDVGAGKGEFLAQAVHEGWEVQGIEPSPSFRKYAKDRCGIELHAGCLGDPGTLPENYFDVITLNHVLEHVVQPYALLDLIRRYLKEDGILFIEVPNCDSYFLRVLDLYFRIKGLNWSSRLSPFHAPFHRFGYTTRSLTFLMERSMYNVLCTATFSGRDRGFQRKRSGWHPEVILREIASSSFQFVGNRELLALIARPMQ